MGIYSITYLRELIKGKHVFNENYYDTLICNFSMHNVSWKICCMEFKKYELRYTHGYTFRMITFGELFSGNVKGIEPEMNVFLTPIQECAFSIKDKNNHPQPQLF